MQLDQAVIQPKPKRAMLPVLTFLLILCYGLLTLLVVEQGSTIESQRYLIKQLFYDSSQLTALKGKQFQERAAQARTAPPQAKPSTPPSAANPSLDQARPQERAENNCSSCKTRKPVPQAERPPVQAAEKPDVRRTLVSI